MLKTSSDQPHYPRILIITQRYLGDTLLTTALIHSLRFAYPNARIDVLLPKANASILHGNPDINNLLFFPEKSGIPSFLTFIQTIFRRYDLSLSLQNSDRTTLCAILAAKFSIGFVDAQLKKAWWKKLLLSASLVSTQTHTLLENLRFCKLLNITPLSVLIPPVPAENPIFPELESNYAVLHIMPQWRFKEWHLQGWLEVIDFLKQQNLQIVLTGSPNTHELAAIEQLVNLSHHSIVNYAGQLSIPDLSMLIKDARVFIGPDTGITHLASATGTPCIALFGPTNPAIWAPWPHGYQSSTNPFSKRGIQTIKNVYLLQNPSTKSCVPCQNEGCHMNRQSNSECLDNLSATLVIEFIQKALNAPPSSLSL